MLFEIQESSQDVIISIDSKELQNLELTNSGTWWNCGAKLSSQKDAYVFIGREDNDRQFTNVSSLDLGTRMKVTESRGNPVYHINVGEKAYESLKMAGYSRERFLGGQCLIIKLNEGKSV